MSEALGSEAACGSEVWEGLSRSQVCWTAPATRVSLILCLWDLQSLGLEGVAGHWDHLGQGRVCRPGDPADTHVSLILTWDELIVDSFILGAWGGVMALPALGSVCPRGSLPAEQLIHW